MRRCWCPASRLAAPLAAGPNSTSCRAPSAAAPITALEAAIAARSSKPAAAGRVAGRRHRCLPAIRGRSAGGPDVDWGPTNFREVQNTTPHNITSMLCKLPFSMSRGTHAWLVEWVATRAALCGVSEATAAAAYAPAPPVAGAQGGAAQPEACWASRAAGCCQRHAPACSGRNGRLIGMQVRISRCLLGSCAAQYTRAAQWQVCSNYRALHNQLAALKIRCVSQNAAGGETRVHSLQLLVLALPRAGVRGRHVRGRHSA